MKKKINKRKGKAKIKIIKILLIIIAGIVLINTIAFMIATFTEASLILKIKPLNKVFIFAHGRYITLSTGEKLHITTLNGETFSTYSLLNVLREEGFNYIWISMCEQGNSDYIIDYGNGTKINWGDDVSRVKKAGDVYPIFWGLGIYRLVINENGGDGNSSQIGV